jgi:hypothetical protein
MFIDEQKQDFLNQGKDGSFIKDEMGILDYDTAIKQEMDTLIKGNGSSSCSVVILLYSSSWLVTLYWFYLIFRRDLQIA